MEDFQKGKKERPKLAIDIDFYSPKIIINELLLGEKLMDHDEIASLVLDLG